MSQDYPLIVCNFTLADGTTLRQEWNEIDMARGDVPDWQVDGPPDWLDGGSREKDSGTIYFTGRVKKGREDEARRDMGLAAGTLREQVDLHELAADERREIEGELFAIVDRKGYPVVRHGGGDPQPCWPCTVSLLVDTLPAAGAALAPLLAFCVAWNAMGPEARRTAADYISGELGTEDDRRDDMIAAFDRAMPVLQDTAVDGVRT